MAVVRSYAYRNGKIVEITGEKLQRRTNLSTVDRTKVITREAIMEGIPEASMIGHERIERFQRTGEHIPKELRRRR